MVSEVVARLMALESILRVCHWMFEGGDFVDFHQDLGEWHDEVGDLIDELVETVQGLDFDVDIKGAIEKAAEQADDAIYELGDNSTQEAIAVVKKAIGQVVEVISVSEETTSVDVVYDEILRWANHVRYIIGQSRP